MSAFIAHQRRLLVALFVAVACAGGAGLFFASQGVAAPAPAPRQAPDASVLVLRAAAGHDALWLVSPADGTAAAAGTLPGRAGSVAIAPNGQNVAYLPENGAPRVWFGYGALAPRTISLGPAGVKKVDSFTWITDDKLLVSGVTTGTYASPRRDRLFLVTVSTGKVRAFRNLRGTEPSAAPGIGKVAYVKLTTLAAGSPANGNSPLIRESLKLLRLDRSGAGRTIATEEYRLFADYRAMSHPMLSPLGDWLLTGQTGSDVSVTYSIRDTDIGVPFLTMFAPAIQAEAGWDAAGQRTAFGGTPSILYGDEACVWVYNTATGAMARTPLGLLPKTMITDLAWSADGRIVAGAYDNSGASTTRRVLVMPGDNLAAITDLGTGRLPVWVE